SFCATSLWATPRLALAHPLVTCLNVLLLDIRGGYRSGKAGDLVTRRSARKGPTLALPTLRAEQRSFRATLSASPSTTAAARTEFAGHFAHAALELVKAFVPRSSLHDQIHAQLDRGSNQDARGLRATAPR
ncbi:hypothetical protein TUN199_11769, partial [Pyrenophora tritici-repentis]